MIFQCDDLERALRSPELMPDARAHAERCVRCARELYLWEEISRLAPGLQEHWDSPGLWPRIQAGIRADLAVRHPERSQWFRWGRWARAAAAVTAIAVVLLRPGTTPGGPDFLTDNTLREVQQAEAAYARSIDKLSAIAGPGLEQSPSPLAAAYREKLLLLDSSIEELKANIASNRYNAYLQTQLASLYREKQKTLQDWLENAKRN
jgi:hypothetical protein